MYWKEYLKKIKNAEKEGVVFEVKGIKFKLALASVEYAKALEKKATEAGVISPEHLNDDIIYGFFIEFMIKGWSGIYGEDGNEIPFSIDKAKEVLLEKDEEGKLYFDEILSKLASYSVNEKEFYKRMTIKN